MPLQGRSGSTGARLQSSSTRFAIVAAGLTFLLTFEFLRAWAVTMPFFYDGSLNLSAPLRGLLAFSPFVVAFLAAALFTLRRPPLIALAVMVAAMRLALQFVGPGLPRLVIVLVGTGACLSLLVGVAPRRSTVVALVGALAADSVLLMALQTESLVFRHGSLAAAGAVALCVALVGCWRLSRGAGEAAADGTVMRAQLPAPHDSLLPWLGFGPALALHLTVASLPAPVAVVTGWDPTAARVLVAGSYIIAAVLAFWGLGRTPKAPFTRLLPFLAAALILGSSLTALFVPTSDWAVVAAVLLPIGLLAGLAFLARLPGSPAGIAVRIAGAAAFTLGVGVPMLFYLGFVYRYPVVPAWLLAATACVFAGLLALVGVFNRPVDQLSADAEVMDVVTVSPGLPLPALSLAALPGRGPADPVAVLDAPSPAPPASARHPARWRNRWLIAMMAAAITFLIAAPVVGGDRSIDRSPLNGFPVRVASYNIFMGLGADVNMDLDRLARQIASQNPDVVALQEVSRGWFTSGSVDLLPRIAERLGYSYRFFPAANQTWGNAILTNLPSGDHSHGFLPQGIAAMRRGWGAEVLELGNGQQMLFAVTHLYNPPEGHELRAKQAEVLVQRIAAMAERYQLVDMTVVVGDLNAESEAEELASLRHRYADVFTYLDPVPTYPSWAPSQRIDHMFSSPGLRGSDAAVFGGLASDHLGLAVTLRPDPAAPTPGQSIGEDAERAAESSW